MSLRNAWTQWFPPAATFTESDVPSQAGKVFIVTGGNAGIGFELVRILYSKGAKVYMASRSEQKARDAIKTIVADKSIGSTTGQIVYLHLDLNDLSTIKDSVSQFAAKESRLDVLWNNAGVGAVPAGTKTKQNLEQHMGVNCVAPLFFTTLLLPQLRAAAKAAPKASVRVIWTSSWMAESQGPKDGMDFDELAKGGTSDPQRNYAVSKVGNWLLAVEGAHRYSDDGILSLVQNPGNLVTNIWQHVPKLTMLMLNPLLHNVKLGAYTELYAGLSSDITAADNGRYIIPWGRLQKSSPRTDIVAAMKDGKNGGTGVANKFWVWCEEQTRLYE